MSALAGHPRGILVLCLVEMWERFSYYGMRALLILYLIDHLAMPDARAAMIYGAYTSMVYGFCVFGGWVGDRFVGQWRSVATGACLIMAGHLGLGFQDLGGLSGPVAERAVAVSLALVVAGTGLFKPSSTTLVGRLYPEGGERRETGFQLFYFGINLGAAVSALACGALAARWGWGWGLGAAAGGMAVGLVALALGGGELRAASVQPLAGGAGALLAPVLMVAAAATLILNPPAVGLALLTALVVALLVLGRFALREADGRQRRDMLMVLVLVAAAAVFWSLSEQAGSALNLFADRMVDLDAGPVRLSAPQTQSLSPIFILLLTPALAAAWIWLSRRRVEPGVLAKHAAALGFAGLGFLSLVAGIVAAGGGRVALWWLVASYFLQTVGEVCLAPTAYAAVSRLAPARISSLLMGLWLFSISIGNFVGASVATLVARPVGEVSDAVAESGRYAAVFGGVAATALVAAAVLALLAFRMREGEA